MCAFNYRFVPAVRLARRADRRRRARRDPPLPGRYLQDWGSPTPTLALRAGAAGSGALGDLGTHVVDLARYLVGELDVGVGALATFQPGREVDDAFEAAVAFESGAVGTLEASRFAAGRKNGLV